MTGLTLKQAECLEVIKDFRVQFGASPSFDEIQGRLGMSSKGGVHRLLDALEQRGHISREKHRARSIEVIPETVDVRTLERMGDVELRRHIAIASGILAHRTSGSDADAVLNRIGARLAGRPI